MSDFNKLILCGRAGANAEIHETSNGFKVMRFNLAVNRGGKNNNRPMWIAVACWNEKLSETVCGMIKKGTQLICEGELGMDQWKNDSGNSSERATLVMHMNGGTIQILTPKSENIGE